MGKFLEIYSEYYNKFGWCLKIYHSSIVDWHLTIGYKPTHPDHGKTIIDIQHIDYEYLLAKAQVELKDWLLENNGGY